MKKYRYQLLQSSGGNSPLIHQICKEGENGWRVKEVKFSDGGNLLAVLMEQERSD